MKKRMIVIIILVCVLAIGVIEWKTKKNFTTDASKINEIIVEETMDNVKVKVSEDDQIHISYYEGINYHYNITEDNKTLNIKGNSNIPIVVDFQSSSLIIRVPKDYGKRIKINTEKSCSIDEAIEWHDVQIKADND